MKERESIWSILVSDRGLFTVVYLVLVLVGSYSAYSNAEPSEIIGLCSWIWYFTKNAGSIGLSAVVIIVSILGGKDLMKTLYERITQKHREEGRQEGRQEGYAQRVREEQQGKPPSPNQVAEPKSDYKPDRKS